MTKARLLIISTIIVTAALISILIGNSWLLKTPQEKLKETWRDDLAKISQSQKLPPAWKMIRSIEIVTSSQIFSDETLLRSIMPAIPTNSNEKYNLEIFVIDYLSSNRYGVIIHYSLINSETQNKIWEEARTFKLGWLF